MTASFNDIFGVFRQDMYLRTQDLDVVSSNLSNVNTTAYDPTRSNFQEVLESKSTKGGSTINSNQILVKQGSFTITENQYDLAIQGDGYFQIILPNGTTAYTRDGSFNPVEDENGNIQLSHSSGYLLDVTWDSGSPPSNGETLEITDAGEVGTTVPVTRTMQVPDYDENGNLIYDENGNIVMVDREYTSEEFVRLGTINLARFTNPGGLLDHGNNLYVASVNSGEAIEGTSGLEGFGTIKTSALEQSTVNLGNELTHLLTLQRGLTVSARGFQETDNMISLAISMRR